MDENWTDFSIGIECLCAFFTDGVEERLAIKCCTTDWCRVRQPSDLGLALDLVIYDEGTCHVWEGSTTVVAVNDENYECVRCAGGGYNS